MKSIKRISSATLATVATAFALSACATVQPPSPVEITRFHQADVMEKVGSGIVFIESVEDGEALELAPYKSAIATELTALGYREGDRQSADTIVRVQLEQYRVDQRGDRRGPVSVGVGGSTGSYGSGVGLGVGINLGGGGGRDRIGTELSVAIRPVTSAQSNSTNLWEGRALIETSVGTPEAAPAFTAKILAEALFRDFPGGNGETQTIEVGEFNQGE